MCIRGQSPQIMIHDLYELAVNTHTKGLLVTLYSYDLKEEFENSMYGYYVILKNNNHFI